MTWTPRNSIGCSLEWFLFSYLKATFESTYRRRWTHRATLNPKIKTKFIRSSKKPHNLVTSAAGCASWSAFAWASGRYHEVSKQYIHACIHTYSFGGPFHGVCFPLSHLGFKLGVVACGLLPDLGFRFEGFRPQGCRVAGVSLFTSTYVRTEQVHTWVC